MSLSFRRAFVTLALGACTSLPAVALLAPTPDSGTLQSQGDALQFEGGPIVGANISPSTGSPVCLTKAVECEVYTVTVDPASGGDIAARITIEWSDGTNDLDIYLVDADGEIVGQSATGANPEVFEVGRLPPGDYVSRSFPTARPRWPTPVWSNTWARPGSWHSRP